MADLKVRKLWVGDKILWFFVLLPEDVTAILELL